MDLTKKLKKENIFMAENYRDTDEFYTDYVNFLRDRGHIKDNETVKRLFIKRENVQSTAIKKGAAAPHIFSKEFSEFLFSIALIKEGMDFKAPDDKKVYLVFLIMSDERDVGLHLKSLARIARLVRCTDVVDEAKKAKNAEELYTILLEKDKLI
jgi:PTS system nitrogen regulatory IIA component